MQEIFMIAEKTSREITEDKENNGVLSKIDATDMVSRLAKNSDVISKYNSILGSKDITIEEEIKDNTLERILSLYFRVRAFSYAKTLYKNTKEVSKQRKPNRYAKTLNVRVKSIQQNLNEYALQKMCRSVNLIAYNLNGNI